VAASGEKPVLILTGPPGVGKTTAAGILAERPEESADLLERLLDEGALTVDAASLP
jgi:broad-specificity NMP kinase